MLQIACPYTSCLKGHRTVVARLREAGSTLKCVRLAFITLIYLTHNKCRFPLSSKWILHPSPYLWMKPEGQLVRCLESTLLHRKVEVNVVGVSCFDASLCTRGMLSLFAIETWVRGVKSIMCAHSGHGRFCLWFFTPSLLHWRNSVFSSSLTAFLKPRGLYIYFILQLKHVPIGQGKASKLNWSHTPTHTHTRRRTRTHPLVYVWQIYFVFHYKHDIFSRFQNLRPHSKVFFFYSPF